MNKQNLKTVVSFFLFLAASHYAFSQYANWEGLTEIFTKYHGALIWYDPTVKSYTATTYEAKENFGNTMKGEIKGITTFKQDNNVFSPYCSVVDIDYSGKSRYVYVFNKLSGELRDVNVFELSGEQELLSKIDFNKATNANGEFNNDLTKETIYKGNGQYYKAYILQSKNNIITEEAEVGSQNKTNYFYQNGNLIEKIERSPTKTLETKNFEYNDRNDQIKETSQMLFISNTWKSYYSHSYEYDSRGNWVKRIDYYYTDNHWKPTYISERQIEYK